MLPKENSFYYISPIFLSVSLITYLFTLFFESSNLIDLHKFLVQLETMIVFQEYLKTPIKFMSYMEWV